MAEDHFSFVINPPDPSFPYLGNADVVYGLFSEFARRVMVAYDEFLQGRQQGSEAEAAINAIAKEFGDIVMGRDPHYKIAPWQGPRMEGKYRAIYQIKNTEDVGVGLFKWLADQCTTASLLLVEGRPDEEVGKELNEILRDAADRFLGLI